MIRFAPACTRSFTAVAVCCRKQLAQAKEALAALEDLETEQREKKLAEVCMHGRFPIFARVIAAPSGSFETTVLEGVTSKRDMDTIEAEEDYAKRPKSR